MRTLNILQSYQEKNIAQKNQDTSERTELHARFKRTGGQGAHTPPLNPSARASQAISVLATAESPAGHWLDQWQ